VTAPLIIGSGNGFPTVTNVVVVVVLVLVGVLQSRGEGQDGHVFALMQKSQRVH